MEILVNKKALHDLFVLETIEAGLVLSGPEVKSLKGGHADLKGSYISISARNEPIATNLYISPYPQAKREQRTYDPARPRKLLLNKKEINYLAGKQRERGLTIVPLAVYTKNNLLKLKIGICKGKKKFDKREEMKKKEIKRKIERALRIKI